MSFANWLLSHTNKAHEERWLREIYPWPVLAQIECDRAHIGVTQHVMHDGVAYEATIRSSYWQPDRGTFKHRVLIESQGLGWHSRSFSDTYDMCSTSDGTFVTLFHIARKEPLEKIARAFFQRRWSAIPPHDFKSLAVSRFLAASLVSEIAERAYGDVSLSHYPEARIAGGYSPMLARGTDLWLGFRFFSEDAFAWARNSARHASRVVSLYFADTKYQFQTNLPPNTSVTSIIQVDAQLGNQYQDLILTLLRRLELPTETPPLSDLEMMVRGRMQAPSVSLSDSDVHEALAALKRPCDSKAELRYQLAAGVVLNAWIESERALGFVRRKKFYAFKQRIGVLSRWLVQNGLPGVSHWVEPASNLSQPIMFIRVDDVDFSFHAIPGSHRWMSTGHQSLTWSGIQLKPIAPLVLCWARLLKADNRRAHAVTGAPPSD